MTKERRGIRTNGDYLRELRQANQWSQETAASRGGISVKLLRKAEYGKPIDAESVAILAALYSDPERVISPQDLMAGLSVDAPTIQDEAHAAELGLLDQWLLGLWVQGDWQLLNRIVAPTIRFHCRGGVLTTREQLQVEIASIRASLSALSPKLESRARFGSLVVGRWRMQIQHSMDLSTPKPSGKPVELIGITTFRVIDGIITEGWEYWHPLPTYEQLERITGQGSAPTEGLPREADIAMKSSSSKQRSFRVVGDFLRSLRNQQAWTQLEAVSVLGVSERLLRKAEAGGPVDAKTLATLARGYSSVAHRVTPDQLLAEPGELRFLPPSEFELGARVQRWFDAQWNRPDGDVLDALATPDFTFHTEVGVIRGTEELKARVQEFRRSFSDFAMIAEEVCDLGDALTVRWVCTMTHTGLWLNHPATGRKVTVRGASWAQLINGKFSEAWDFWDPAMIYGQLVDPTDDRKP